MLIVTSMYNSQLSLLKKSQNNGGIFNYNFMSGFRLTNIMRADISVH